MRSGDAALVCAAAREREELPGLAVAAASRDGVVFSGAWGEADLENHVPVRVGSIFEVASVTKLFTAEAVLLLVQDGSISLDAPLGDLVPELPPSWHAIRIESILSHQSGLPSYTEADGYWAGAAVDRGADGILGLVADLPLLFEQGERYAYDNTGFYLLGTVIERVSRMDYGTFLQERILGPLELDAIRVNDYRLLVPGRVRGYSRSDTAIVNKAPYSSSNTFSAGVLLASAPDLARFGAAVQANGLLAPELRQRMRTPRPSRLGNERSAGFQVGLGWFLMDDGDRRYEGHGGEILGFRSSLIGCPEEGIVVAVLANADWFRDPEGLALEVARSLV